MLQLASLLNETAENMSFENDDYDYKPYNNTTTDTPPDDPVSSPDAKHYDILIPLGIFCSVGVLGNILFCTVVFVDRRLFKQRTNVLLLLMAFGDMMVLISQYVRFYHALNIEKSRTVTDIGCHMEYAAPTFAQALCIFSLTACSIERYLGVVKFPLGNSTTPWLFTVIACVVIVVLSLALGGLTWWWVFFQPGSHCLAANFFDEKNYRWSQLGSTFLLYVIPLFIVSFCYFAIARRIVQSSAIHKSQLGVRRSFARRKTGILVLSTITLSFALLWLPFHVARLLLAFQPFEMMFASYFSTLVDVYRYSAVANAVLDPVLIFMLSSEHRRAVCDLYSCCFCRKDRYNHTRVSTTRSTIYTGSSVKKINGITSV